MFDPEFRKPFPNVQRYWQTLAAQPQFAKVVGTSWSLPTEALKPPSNKDSKPKESKPKVPDSVIHVPVSDPCAPQSDFDF